MTGKRRPFLYPGALQVKNEKAITLKTRIILEIMKPKARYTLMIQ